MGRRGGEPVARDASTLRTATGRNVRAANARPADMGPAAVRTANMSRPRMHPAAACTEACSAAVPAKPAPMSAKPAAVSAEPAAVSAKASEVSATTVPTATAPMSPAATAPATAGVCFEGEKRHDEEQHRRQARADSHGAAGLAPHRSGRLSLCIPPRTKSFQY
jgi:hypothetical protein